MASCYASPPQKSQPFSHSSDTMGVTSAQEHAVLLDLQRSIYVFPNPPSAPPSPSASSLSDIRSDYSGTIPGSSNSGSREHSLSCSRNPSRPRGRSHERSLGPPGWQVVASSRSANPTGEGGPDLEVEVWDWVADYRQLASLDATWELEAEVERVGRWGLPTRSLNQAWTSPLVTHPSSSQPLAVTIPSRSFPLHTHNGHYLTETRSRTHSNSSGTSLSSGFSSRLSTVQTPQPRVHIPLLSFIASIFSLDLDDPALRLLTSSSSTSESILFPGHDQLLKVGDRDDSFSNVDITNDDTDGESVEEDVVEPQSHGLLRLLVTSDESRLSMRSIRDGLTVVCTRVPPSNVTPFSLPSLGSVLGFCRIVGDVWMKGRKGWHEIRTTN